MSGATPIEGYPYPLTSDFADVQDAFRLATAIDADLRAEQAPFRAFMGRPSFIGRQGTTQTLFQMTAIDWDNTGGVFPGFWQQPIGQQPSWWMFGCTLLVNIVSGSPVVGDLNMAQIQVTSTNQVSGVATTTSYFQRNDETVTGGEWINMFAMAPIYQGSVNLQLTTEIVHAVRSIAAGSRLWGMYLGPVT
jgi:hypothetical protein